MLVPCLPPPALKCVVPCCETHRTVRGPGVRIQCPALRSQNPASRPQVQGSTRPLDQPFFPAARTAPTRGTRDRVIDLPRISPYYALGKKVVPEDTLAFAPFVPRCSVAQEEIHPTSCRARRGHPRQKNHPFAARLARPAEPGGTQPSQALGRPPEPRHAARRAAACGLPGVPLGLETNTLQSWGPHAACGTAAPPHPLRKFIEVV